MNHTPGPWHAGRIGEHEFEKPAIFTADSHQLADVFVHGGVEQARANAGIMAAAPDLVAALEAVIEVAEREGTTGNHEIISLARAAIAKATAAPAAKDE